MTGLKQTKRVSWPTDGNLCKVRLFLSEDAPSQSGLGTQDNLQAKSAWLLHAGGLDSEDSLPPGFEERHKYQHPKIEISQIPLIKWQCPPRVVLNPDWRVVAGEESVDVAIESQRQPGVLEAVYPRIFSVPPNPFVTADVQAGCFDDSFTPPIPLTAIEDDDATEQAYTSMPQVPVLLPNLPNAGPLQNSITHFRFISEQLQSQSNAVSSVPNMPCSEQLPSASVMPTTSAAHHAEPDVLAAASAAFTAIMRSSEEGSMIDRELLIKILSDPVMVQRLLLEYGAPKQTAAPQLGSAVTIQTAGPSWPPPQPVVTTITAPPSRSQMQPVITATTAPPSRPPVQPAMTTNAAAPSRPSPQPVITITAAAPSRPPPSLIAPSGPLSAPPSSHVFHMPNHVPPPALNPHHHPPHLPTVTPVRPPPAPAVKNVYYYKSLIQLHGGDKQEGPDQNPVQFGNLVNPVDYHNNVTGVSNSTDPVGPGLGGVSNAMGPIGLNGMNQRDPKAKILKLCAYFNTPRGCRHGASCLFKHDASSIPPQRIEQQKGTTKRIKLDGAFGRN